MLTFFLICLLLVVTVVVYTVKWRIVKRPVIDAVVTWVDTTDQTWQRLYEQHTGKRFENGIRWTPASAGPETELATCLELIRRNMPWVRRTYVVTMAPQRPKCILDEIVVHHDAMGLGPVFNSHAIESSLHRIPGIAEHFVYINDDIYVRKPVTPSTFLTLDNRPIVRVEGVLKDGEWSQINKYTADVISMSPLAPRHTPHMLTKTMFLKLEREFPDAWNDTRQCALRYDCDTEIAPIIAALQLALRDGTAVRDWLFSFVTDLYIGELPFDDNYVMLRKIRRAHFVCINQLDGDGVMLHRALQLNDRP